MKAGDKLRVKPWKGELNGISFHKMYSDREYTYIQTSSTGNAEVVCNRGITWYFPKDAFYLAEVDDKPQPEPDIVKRVKDAYLGKAVFQGYSSGRIRDDKFVVISESNSRFGDDMSFNNTHNIPGTLSQGDQLTAITVEDYLRQKYHTEDVVTCLVVGMTYIIPDSYFVILNEEEQLIDIEMISSSGNIRVRVFDKGKWAESGEDVIGGIQSVTFGPYSSKPTEIEPNESYFEGIFHYARQFPRTTAECYAKAVSNDEPNVIKTKKSKGLDINIKSSKFVIPKIK